MGDHEDTRQFDHFLITLAECKTSRTKLSRAMCVIKQATPPTHTPAHPPAALSNSVSFDYLTGRLELM